MWRALTTVLLLTTPVVARAAASQSNKVIDLRVVRPPSGNSFEALWGTYRAAEARGDETGAANAMREIRRLRSERNIRSLEPFALAHVGQGLERLAAGERQVAEEAIRGALALDPALPDAHFALARVAAKKGPLGIAAAARHVVAGFAGRFATIAGRYHLLALAVAAGLLALLVALILFSAALMLRHASLLLHDLEERLGPLRGRGVALAVWAFILLLPVVTFQGFGWLPMWWLAVLFVYMTTTEKVVSTVLVVAGLGIGPLVSRLDQSTLARQNPLFRAGVLAVEGAADSRAIAALEEAVVQTPDDRDLSYMLGVHYKKAGRYEEALATYSELLRRDPGDLVALNNLANLEFAQGEFQAATTRYRQGIESSPPAEVAATLYYNLSLTYLQRFERQPADEAREHADRVASGLVREYDRSWRYEKGDYAVVDLGPSVEQIWAKFAGTPHGIRMKNVTGRSVPAITGSLSLSSFFNRFLVFLALFVVVVLAWSRLRGPRMFTRRCLKCGTPFCRRCHLGAASAGLCTQCYHLFVVRDGVSGPARNQKLLEVQSEDRRRDRAFRVFSLLAPGSGHVYLQRTVTGLALLLGWALVLSLCLLAGRLLPVTEAPPGPGSAAALGLAGLVLLVLYVVANRSQPELDFSLPVRPRRGRAA
jgi:tetratricopeptide (TPR) repeat protein